MSNLQAFGDIVEQKVEKNIAPLRAAVENMTRRTAAESILSKTPANFKKAILLQLREHRTVSEDDSKPSVLTDDQASALNGCANEAVFVAKLTPHLEHLICKERDRIVNSENIPWQIHDFGAGRPDLFRAKCYVARQPDQPTEAVVKARSDTGHSYAFGMPHEHLLDSVILIEAKNNPIQDKDLQQLYKYLLNLPTSPSLISRGMLVDPTGFMLFEMTGEKNHKTASSLVEGKWTTKGSREAIEAFMLKDEAYSIWDRLLVASCADAKVELVRFLGSGRFGRVYEVKKESGPNEGEHCAMKLVRDCSLAQKEVRALLSADKLKCPVVRPCHPEVKTFANMDGGYYLLSPVGQEVTRQTAVDNLQSVLKCLEQLHQQGAKHGDARIRNLIQTTDKKLLWIDFLDADVSHCVPVTEIQKRHDFEMLIKSLGASDGMIRVVKSTAIHDICGFKLVSQLQQHLKEGN